MATFESILRYGINGSPLQIELVPGLANENGPLPGAVIYFTVEREEMFCLVLDTEDMQALVDMLTATMEQQAKGGSQ